MQAALIGLGMVADMHADAIAATGGKVRLAGVLASSQASAERFLSRRADDIRIFPDIQAIGADPAVDFAILTTPPDARHEIVETLAAAGKPILMEKPIERFYQAARGIVEVCERAETPLGIVLQHRMRKAAIHLKALLDKGALGAIAAVEVTVPWWRDQSYYDTPGRGTYARDGGGVLITQAIHTLDLMLWLAGPVTNVQAMARTTALHQMEAEDFVSAGLAFASGAAGSVVASTASFPGGAEKITLHCADASATLDAAELTIQWRDGRTDRMGRAEGTGGGADPMAFGHHWHQRIIEDFAEAISAGRPPAVPGHEALAVHALIDAMQLSSREGRRVDVAGEIGHG